MPSKTVEEQRAAGWIEHDGKGCPVPPDSRPAIMFGDGHVIPAGRHRAGYWLVGYWTQHFPPREQIVAYRTEAPDA